MLKPPVALILVGEAWHLVHVALIRLDAGEDPVPFWCEKDGSAVCPVGNEDRVFSLTEIEER